MAPLVYHEAGDVDEQAGFLAGYRQAYEQLGRGRFYGRLWQRAMPAGVLFRESTNRQLRQVVHPPPDHVAIAVPVSVEQSSRFAGRPLTLESLMVLSGSEEYELTSAGAMDLVGISVHGDVLASLAVENQEWLHRATRTRHLQVAPDSAAAIRKSLLSQLDDAADRLPIFGSAAGDVASLATTVTKTVLLAMSGEDQSCNIPRRAESRLRVVRRAIEYLHTHLHEDVPTAEICRAACASRRTLQYCFEEFLQTTPQTYLRALRLNEARRRLKSSADAQITFVATEFGFNSASHFTRQYRSMFGELPSQTMRASRQI